MANWKHLDVLKQGVDVWNQWRRDHPAVQPDLSRADFRNVTFSDVNLSRPLLKALDADKLLVGADLVTSNLFATIHSSTNQSGVNHGGANLIGVNLIDADLRGADLVTTNLIEAFLMNANLSGTVLAGAILMGANLRGADLRGANLSGANLIGTNLSGAKLSKANLGGANLSGADLRGADLTGCFIYAISAWNVQLENTIQADLIITPSNEPIITVDDLEVAQFIYLLLNHKKLRNVLNAVTAKGVLILGRFGGGGLEVLQAIAAKLREEKYLPIIFDFERPQAHDYTETVKTLIGMVRFVIVDLSGPSVPQELSHTVPFFDIPFVPILEKGRHSYAMFRDLLKYPWVLRPPLEFATAEDLLARMASDVIAPAEEKHQARQKLLDELFKKA